MSEENRGEGGPTPEQKTGFTPSWVMEKADEYHEYDSRIQRLAQQLHRMPPAMLTPEFLSNQYSTLLQEVLDNEIPEADASTLMARIGVKHEELAGLAKVSGEGRKSVEPELGDTLTEAIKDLSLGVKDLRKLLEDSGQMRPPPTQEQIQQMGTTDTLGAYSQQTEVLRRAFGRLPTEEEEGRWIDVEYEQEFYTRFAPNQEPYFYTELSSAERKIWDARWRLARAAFYKKVYGAFPDKLAENQDLIELGKEQMETLYKLPGVREALEWYAGAIVRGDQPHPSKKKPGGAPFLILDCESAKDFDGFREKLREYLRVKIFKITDFQLEGMSQRDRDKVARKIRSADAVAWNWIFCSNLNESVDSRYSGLVSGRDFRKGHRHDHLAPALCSDDLRSVFHPQEKFENKCLGGLEWGAYGKWGLLQIKRVKGEKRYVGKNDRIVFEGAAYPEEFWEARRNGKVITVTVPECYPTTTMKSFWESYKEGESENALSLLDKLLARQKINWDKVQADPWKTSYLTVKLRKAVGLFDHFMGKTKTEGGWTLPLLDIYRRLSLDKSPNYHNLKIWAHYVGFGGVKDPSKKYVTPPYGPIDRWSYETFLKQPRIRYLDREEGLALQ